MGTSKRLKRFIFIAIALVFVSLVFFLFRGPYLSNAFKRLILPELEEITGERVVIDKVVLNPFPLYVEARRLKLSDKDGNTLLKINKVRAYIELSGLPSKNINIGRLIIKEPEITSEKEDIDRVVKSVKKYIAEDKGKAFKVRLKSIKLTGGNFNLQVGTTRFRDGDKKTTFSGDGLSSEVVIKERVTVDFKLKSGVLKVENIPEIKGGIEGRIKLDSKKTEIIGVKFSSSGSTIEASGDVYPGKGILSAKANVLLSTLKDFFNLKEKGDGVITLSGSVKFDGSKAMVDLKTRGWFYLETLMEFINIKEDISGLISVDGKISGIYPEIKGEGDVTFKNGKLSTLPVDDMKGRLNYENKVFTMKDFTARIYGGALRGNARLRVPGGAYYVKADVSDIDSPGFLKFIGWEPPIPAGKISGNFELAKEPDKEFSVQSHINYLNKTPAGPDILGRLKKIEGTINLKNNILTISNSNISTAISTLFLEGTVNFSKSLFDLKARVESADATDLMSPYYSFKAPVSFVGGINGLISDPVISGEFSFGQGILNEVTITKASGSLTYKIKSLSVGSLKVEQGQSVYDISGSISFKEAEDIFSFPEPYFEAKAKIKKGDLGLALKAVYKELPITGSIDGDISFKGSRKDFKSSANIVTERADVFGQLIDKAIISAIINPQDIVFPLLELQREESRLSLKGSLSFDGKFSFTTVAGHNTVNLKDVTAIPANFPINVRLSLDAKGSGTFEKPNIMLSARVLEGSLKDAKFGKGEINAQLDGKQLNATGNLFNNTLIITGKANLSKTLLWDIDLKFRKGRYDFLLAAYLKDIPRDLAVFINGDVKVTGEGKKVFMQSKLNALNVSLYGYNLRNQGDIIFELAEKDFRIKALSLKGDYGDISVRGGLKLGHSYNIAIEGRMDIAPLKAMTKDIESLRGEGNFVVEATGPWESPELKGGINIRNASMLLVDFPHRIGPLDGNVYFDHDRVIFDSFNAGFGGGKVKGSGVGYLKGMSLKRLFFDSQLQDIRLRPIEGADVTFNGKLFYEISSKDQRLSGDVFIEKARYNKRIEWKSWLVSLKPVEKLRVEQPGFFGRTALNIHLSGQDNIVIDNNVARTPIKVDMILKGTVNQPRLLGRLEAAGGIVFFRSNEFRIINGRVDFIDPNRIYPIFHIQAETVTKGYYIKLNLDGPIDKFTLSLFSSPPLSEMDILALLTVGQITKELKGFEGGVGAGEAASFLTGRLQHVMEERLKNITGFDRF
ncbi:MAG: translocation/assembly module TamB domain-containing protein, partial [Nitrospirae bacterium]|nr:translocation/assembly module TamB domain-containing protein [Nitrospirota bacterium]